MLSQSTLETILGTIPRLALAVVGDLFLDRYLDIDPRLTEPSLETGLDAYQVVRVRPSPGAAGTVVNNLAALGVGRVEVISVIGDDGEGYELCQALGALGPVRAENVFSSAARRTPTYTKPMLLEPGGPPRELNRLDIKNRTPLPGDAEEQVLSALTQTWQRMDGLLVLDQVSEPGCGVVTENVRRLLARLGDADPGRMILADSREFIGRFHSVWLKPNQAECDRAAGPGHIADGAAALAERTGRPVFCTRGERGIQVVDPRPGSGCNLVVPAYPVAGPIDVVGAGDSTSAGIACAVAAGVGLGEAAAFGNLVASITIQQIGTTGTASPQQVRRRWQECHGG
jgi:bifunctional ADP-heptose synthase (sugar kinase/adenylyltransferase)